MNDGNALAAIITATLGGLATLAVAVATLVATLKGNRRIDAVSKGVNGRVDELIGEASRSAYERGRADERLAWMKACRGPADRPGACPGADQEPK